MKVYIKPGCPWCVEVVEWLDAAGYKYHKLNVAEDRALYQEMIELSGQSKAPTMTYGDLLLANFGVEELVPFLEEHGIEP